MPDSIVILNVNDDGATRYLMTRILRKGGFEVLEAASGTEALQLVEARRPDLLLLDIKLPDMSGLDVCRRIKGDPALKQTLIVQTSATFASSNRKVEGLDSGADAYLAQPVEPLELLATIRAILRTRQAEDKEKRAARHLQRTFDAIRDALLLLGPDPEETSPGSHFIILQHNDAARLLLGEACAPSRQIDVALGDLIDEDTLRQLFRDAWQGRRELEAQRGERTFRVSADPVGDAVDGFVLILSDITDRKRLEEEHRRRAEELAEAARRKDEFLATLAHELRNPLSAISTACTMLERTPGDLTMGVRLRSIIDRQTRNLARMVDDLLEVSRITRGRMRIRSRPVDLVTVIRSALHTSQTAFGSRSQRIDAKFPDGALMIHGDDLRLEQVVNNLLSNASKYSDPGSAIQVELRDVGESGDRWAELRVRDNGVGIPPALLGAIFDPFVQVDQSLARSLGGLGIGLTMVKSLVELHGGQVWAHSQGPGQGAEFTVRLPLRSSELAVDDIAPPPASRQESSTPMRILVVEDNPDTLELVMAWLRSMGHKVQGARDGLSGLELAMAIEPDVALVDIGLPELDGFDVARNVRASEPGQKIYMVAVTGYGRPEDRARALDAGFDAYVVKPMDEATLTTVLDPHNCEVRKKAAARSTPDGHGSRSSTASAMAAAPTRAR